MKMIFAPVVLASLIAVSACGGEGDDALADSAEDQAEARADNLEQAADQAPPAVAENLEDRAGSVEDRGEEVADSIDDSDVDAEELTPAQREALVNGQ